MSISFFSQPLFVLPVRSTAIIIPNYELIHSTISLYNKVTRYSLVKSGDLTDDSSSSKEVGGQMRQSEKILAAGIMAALLSGMYGAPVWAETVSGQTLIIQAGEEKDGEIRITGDATDNHVYVYGKSLGNGATTTAAGNATKNTVTLKGEGASANFAYGGSSTSGNVNENEVTISGGKVSFNVHGGNAYQGNANGNKVTVSDGAITGGVRGGRTDYGTANENEVTISGETTTVGQNGFWNVYGGSSMYGAANGNKVNVSGGTINRDIYGGSGSGTADFNEINISGGTINRNLYGGLASGGSSNTTSAVHNTIRLTGGEVKGHVIGSYAYAASGTVSSSSNTIEIENAKVDGYVYGGYAPKGSTTSADNNTVILRPGASFGIASCIYGGIGYSTIDGNTLTLDGAKNITLSNVGLFDNYNFYLPAGTKAEDTILHLTTISDTDMRNTNVYVKANGAVDLHNKEKVYLVKKDGGQLLDEGMTKTTDVMVGVTT